MHYKPLTQLAHDLLETHLAAGDITIDATAGNGHDTLFLAQHIGEQGHVHAFDIQADALNTTQQRLQDAGLDALASLHHTGHQNIQQTLAAELRGQISAVTFNLGYLPGSDKNTITQAQSTLAALEQCLALLRPGGVISLLVYRGHTGGMDEANAVTDWLGAQAQLKVETHESRGPVLYWCTLTP